MIFIIIIISDMPTRNCEASQLHEVALFLVIVYLHASLFLFLVIYRLLPKVSEHFLAQYKT